jgi:hemin uptake protein HemP
MGIMVESSERPERPKDPEPAQPPAVIDAGKLFQGSREVWIEYAGVRYRLRITRRGRLILQK